MPDMPFVPREKKIQINGVTYRIKELLASERSIMLFRTNELLGGSIESFVEGFGLDSDLMKAVGGILSGLTKTTTPQEFNSFIKDTIQACTSIPAKIETDLVYENHFCQYFEQIPELLGAIYEQNFGSTVQLLKKKLYDYGIITPPSSKKTPEAEGECEKENSVIPMSQKKTLASTNF